MEAEDWRKRQTTTRQVQPGAVNRSQVHDFIADWIILNQVWLKLRIDSVFSFDLAPRNNAKERGVIRHKTSDFYMLPTRQFLPQLKNSEVVLGLGEVSVKL